MGFPDQSLPGQMCHSIRNTARGTYFLSAVPECVHGLAYTFGLGVERSGIMPHVELTMSNHRHGLFTCLTGWRSKFHEAHHGVFAYQYNGFLGRNGPMWDHRLTTCPVILSGASEEYPFLRGEPDDVAEYMQSLWDKKGFDDVDRTLFYVLMNPVNANLVQHVHSFPGFKVTPQDWGTWRIVRRPHWMSKGYPPVVAFLSLPPLPYCDRVDLIDAGDGRFVVHPDTLAAFEERREEVKRQFLERALTSPRGELRFVDPVASGLFISEERLAEAVEHYSTGVAELEEELRVERAARGQRVLGRRALRRQDPFYCPHPSTRRHIRSTRRPSFIGPAEAVKRAQKALRIWRQNYWCALDDFNETQDFAVLFPAGTVRMVDIASVRCRDGPLPEENPML